MSDEDSFGSLLGDDVKPIKVEQRVQLSNKKNDAVNQAVRRHNATADVSRIDDPLSTDPIDMVDPLDLLEYKKPGVQNGVYRNLRMGKYTIDARLDLHRHTVEQARQSLFQFVKDCLENDVRTALVTHGKGEGREQPALLKSCVAHWLPQLDEVLAFHTAQKQHGSYGATYVLLKKSDRKKLEAKDSNSGRRG